MADRLEAVVDVTVRYPGGAPPFWDFLCGRSPDVEIDIRTLPLPPVDRDAVNAWVNRLWEEKDARLDQGSGRPEP